MARMLCAWLAFVGLLIWGAAPQAQDTRQFWLSPKDGDGSETNPYHARCLEMPGGGAIDLTPYGVNRFLCASNDLPADMTGVVQIGSALSSALGARKAALSLALNQALAANTVEDLIIEVISSRLKAGRDGKLKIYLGEKTPLYQQTAWVPFRDNGLVADATNLAADILAPATAWATTLITETFNCSDGASLTCVFTWTEFNGTAWAIASNVAARSGTAADEARLDSDLATDDHEVQATIAAANAAVESRCGVIARKDSSATRTFYMGRAVFNATPANGYWQSAKRVAGVLTSLATSTTDPAVSDVMILRTDGSSVSLYVNGSLLVGPTTDTDITGNTRVGIASSADNAGDSCSLDNVLGYDYPLPRRGSTVWFY